MQGLARWQRRRRFESCTGTKTKAMYSIKEQKANHELRSNVTSEDEYFYREPEPLTEAQKDQLLQIEEDIKRRIGERDVLEVLWMEKRYGDSCFKDDQLWK